MALTMTGAEMVIKALADQGVEHIFGYPGGAVLPIYDELFQQERVKHILVRQEGGAVHAAEGSARSTGTYTRPRDVRHKTYRPRVKGDPKAIAQAVELMSHAKKPLLYTGGGVINSGPKASQLLRELVRLTGFPITSTLMGLGAFPASSKEWLGMLGMHGTYEANLAMHDCDVMVCLGARFDDRVTGKVSAFSPGSKKIHLDIDA